MPLCQCFTSATFKADECHPAALLTHRVSLKPLSSEKCIELWAGMRLFFGKQNVAEDMLTFAAQAKLQKACQDANVEFEPVAVMEHQTKANNKASTSANSDTRRYWKQKWAEVTEANELNPNSKSLTTFFDQELGGLPLAVMQVLRAHTRTRACTHQRNTHTALSHTFMRMHTHTHTSTHTDACTHTNTHTYTHTHATHAHAHAPTHTHPHTHTVRAALPFRSEIVSPGAPGIIPLGTADW